MADEKIWVAIHAEKGHVVAAKARIGISNETGVSINTLKEHRDEDFEAKGWRFCRVELKRILGRGRCFT